MKSLLAFAAAAAVLINTAWAGPIVVSPGSASDVVVTDKNTVNTTTASSSSGSSTGGKGSLPLSLQNNFDGDQLYAYVTGQDVNGLVVILTTDGTWLYPNAHGSQVPIAINGSIDLPLNPKGQKTNLTLPSYISSGRVFISEGKLQFFTVASYINGTSEIVQPSAANPNDPSANLTWGFMELTYTADGGLFANISFVDWVGLVIGMVLKLAGGETQTVQGLNSTAVSDICDGMKAQAAIDGQPWDEMCVTRKDGTPLRVLSPNLFLSNNASAMSDYYDEYVDSVWTKYSSIPLVIDTQIGGSNDSTVNCTVTGDHLHCTGDNRAYQKPTIGDIWGCNSGPFAIQESDNLVHRAIVPRLCAAFTRSTLLGTSGFIQPKVAAASYYLSSPTNHYSRIIHQNEIDGKGYAFSYDDVTPDGSENAAGVVSGANPQLLELVIGGPSV